ncbi:hypothetical protein [Myxococcus qinghaiensis]|uniref:hypothetical protein n=1 Tax=Myxococcus qinghaiensis TaxID=2906758 RepID=UPI0020A798E5|nr:hypothetical protein [Myxococcus qinghaiensis]MCP3168530.1 hypothetical protein [Myxococcus qinghaiensis]
MWLSRAAMWTCMVICGSLTLSACGHPSGAGDEEDGPTLGGVEQATYAGDLGRSTEKALATGNTCGKTSDYSPSCAFGPAAPDMVYLWRAPSTGMFSFTTLGANFDTVLEVRPYNSTTQSLACNDDIGPGNQQSVVDVPLTSGQVVQIIVDSYGSQCGNYMLTFGKNCNLCHPTVMAMPSDGTPPHASLQGRRGPRPDMPTAITP